MKRLAQLVTLTATGLGLYANTADNITTNVLDADNIVSAVFNTIPQKVLTAPAKVLPTSALFSHRATLKKFAKPEAVGAKTNAPAGSIRAATKAPIRAEIPWKPVLPRRELKYELLPMTTDELAERQAIVGWKVRPRKR